MELWLIIILIIVTAIIAFIIGWRVAIHPDIVSNKEQEKALQKLILEIEDKQKQNHQLSLKNQSAKEKYDEIQKYIEDSNSSAEKIYKNKMAQLEEVFKQKEQVLNNKYQITVAQYKADQEKEKEELESLRATKSAAIEAARKEQLVKSSQEDYCLRIPIEEQNDISILQNIKGKITKPRAIGMCIWSNYYQPLAKKIFPKILGAEKVCGIYKITNQKTGECYIGQSTDCRKRWYDHCKMMLQIDAPAGNKLYTSAAEDGLENFSFELLEECEPDKLNEKEKYFISLYSADTLGFNGNKGVGN